jgi:hypothetical protein
LQGGSGQSPGLSYVSDIQRRERVGPHNARFLKSGGEQAHIKLKGRVSDGCKPARGGVLKHLVSHSAGKTDRDQQRTHFTARKRLFPNGHASV